MKELVIFAGAALIGLATIVVVAKKFGGNCPP
jgi:hypothetical protein